MTKGGVGDHQRLHGQGVLFHEIGDAGVGVDHHLVGQAHLAMTIVLLGGDEMLAEGPVAVVHRQAGEGIGIHHLLGADDLELIGIGVEAVFVRQAPEFLLEAFDDFEAPIRIRADQLSAGVVAHGVVLRISCRNTG